MGHRAGHTLGSELANALNLFSQRELNLRDEERRRGIAEESRQTIRQERLGDVKGQNQLNILLNQLRDPTSQVELDEATNLLQQRGFDLAPRTFQQTQVRDPIEDFRQRELVRASLRRPLRPRADQRTDIDKQIDTTIKEFNQQRRSRVREGKVESAVVRSGREQLDTIALDPVAVNSPRFVKFQEEIEREESKQIFDLEKKYFEGINGFINPVDAEYFQELAQRYPDDKRIQKILEDFGDTGFITNQIRSTRGIQPITGRKPLTGFNGG